MTRKSRYLLIATFVAASLVATSVLARFGSSHPGDDDTYMSNIAEVHTASMLWELGTVEISASREPQPAAPSAEFVPFSARYASNAPMEITEHIQAF